jgi:hypothetical protein
MGMTAQRCLHVAAGIVVLLVSAFVPGSPASAQGLNLVKMKGLVGVKNSPGSLAQMTLEVDGKLYDFSVSDIRRTRGAGEGRALIDRLGLGVVPQLRVIGPPGLLKQISTAAPGSHLTTTGVLSYDPPYYQLTSLKEGSKESEKKPKK